MNLTEVEAWLLIAHDTYGKPEIALDVWQAAAMSQRLRAKRVKVTEFTFSASSVGQLAMTLYRLLRDHQLDLPDDPELIDELANVRLRESSPGVYRMDHDADRHDDRAIALALAAKHLLDRPLLGRRLRYRGTELHPWDPPRSAPPDASPREKARAARDRAYAELMRPKPIPPIGGYP